MRYYLISMLIVLNLIAHGQPAKPCSSPECSQFDFWLGDWELTYNDSVHASNHVSKEMNNCVIYEHFDDPSQSFSGWSWSVYNPSTKLWQQSWVDNQGGYIVLTGKFEDGQMTLLAESGKLKDGSIGRNRMKFVNIKADSFDWLWEVTRDEGKSWQTGWKIHYQRRKN